MSSIEWDQAVTREWSWFGTDAPVPFVGCPPLLKVNGGMFDSMQAYEPKQDATGKRLYLTRDWNAAQDQDYFTNGAMFWRHRLEVHVVWSFRAADGKAETETKALEVAIAAILQRITGPNNDRSHGGTFNAVGVADGHPTVRFMGNPVEAIKSKASLEVSILYGADDLPFYA